MKNHYLADDFICEDILVPLNSPIMKKIPLIISLALALIGCTKQGAAPEAQVSPGIQDDNPGISRDIVNLTADDAVTVAQMFCSKEGKTKGGESLFTIILPAQIISNIFRHIQVII